MARLTKFSDAISSMPLFCRWRSFRIASATSGSVSARVRSMALVISVVMSPSPSASPFRRRNLIEPTLMASTFECRFKPHFQDFVGQSECDDPPAHGKNVRVVVLAREPGHIQIVAQRGTHARHFVGSDLLPLAASAKDDTAVGTPFDDRARDVKADRRVIDRRLTVGPVIVDEVSDPLKRLLQVLFQQKAGVIGADSDAHDARLYYGFMLHGSGLTVRGSRLRI